MVDLILDLETFSETPINYGSHKYAEKAEIIIVTYAFGDGEVKAWDCTADPLMPHDLYEALENPAVKVIIHNSSFDQVLMKAVWDFDLPWSRIHDTQAQARSVGLPGALAKLSEIFKLPIDQAKDKRGKELINLFTKPRPKNSKLRRTTRETHPKEWADFIEYARLDIAATRAVYNKLPAWNFCGSEITLWQLTSKTNACGLYVDTELANAAIRAIRNTKQTLNADTSSATFGIVGSATQRDELLGYILGAYGVDLPDLQASTIERRLNDPELPEGVKELLAQRLQISTTSTAKYQTLLNCVSPDNRLRGTLEYCGAGRTGRDSGRKFQPQNLPSRGLLPPDDIEMGIEALKGNYAELIFPDIMKLASSCIRGCIIAPPGKKLVVSDLSNIEGRDAAWLADETWKIQAFRDFDKGTGEDIYRLAYAKAFNIDVDDVDGGKEKGPQRDIGKVLELAMAYAGGCGAFLTFAAVYNINLDELANAAWDSIPVRIRLEARGMWKWAVEKKQTFGLSEKTFVVCDSLKRMWRESNPAISAYWGKLEQSIEACFSDTKSYECGKLTVKKDGGWLRIILPSGRSLCYASPKMEKNQINYLGIDPYKKTWGRVKSYGGKFFENVCQAVARDVMMHNIPAMFDAGYFCVTRVHDEAVTEAPDTDEYTHEKLSKILATHPPWAIDLPLAASGFSSYRYRK